MKLDPNCKINLICTQCNKQYSTYKCNRKNCKNSYCSSICYGLWQRNRSKESRGILIPKRFCSFEDCKKKHFGKGYCKTHYSRFIELKHRTKIKVKKASKSYYFTCMNCNKKFNRQNKKPKFCCRMCSSQYRKKPFIIKKGYRKILIHNHVRADKHGYVFEHIVILEQKLKRNLFPKEVCHHVDGNKLNNDPNNLINFKDHASHQAFHRKLQSASKCPASINEVPSLRLKK